jgi:hypothetical protein
MSTRTITSPGIQITEIDQSQIARNSAGTNVFMTGFASQGPTDEVVYIGSVSEFEATFGTPTNAAERYLYHSARQVLVQSPANLKVTRMAYGSGAGIGFGNSYSALVFPVKGFTATNTNVLSGYTLNFTTTPLLPSNLLTSSVAALYLSSADHTNGFILDSITYGTSSYHYQTISNGVTGNLLLSINGTSSAYSLTYNNSSVLGSTVTYTPADYTTANYYEIQAPQSLVLTEAEYNDILSNNVSWEGSYTDTSITNSSKIGYGGIVVLNPTKVTVDNIHQGYYIGFADNTDNNPGSDFMSITGVQAVNGVVGGQFQTFTTIPTNRLNFALSGSHLSSSTNISRIMEQFPTGYDFGSSYYNDCLSLLSFKLRTSIYAQDTVTLDYRVQEGYTGSLYNNKTQNNPNGGSPIAFALEKVAAANAKASDLKVIINPVISSTGEWVSSNGQPKKSVRVSNAARNLYSLGTFVSQTDVKSGELGNVPLKLQRILNKLDDTDEEIDILPEAGLGTIWAGAVSNKLDSFPSDTSSDSNYFFDDKVPVKSDLIAGLKSQTAGNESVLKQNYDSIIQQFYTFAEKTRMDHMFIADPLRYIFVNGPDFKSTKMSSYNFSLDVYWPLKNLFGDIATSYGATYGNWVKYNDVYSNQMVWLPTSGYVAADIAFSTATNFPWSAPAGFNRGVLSNIIDLAINPTQKQRDLMYRINVNPIAYFQGDGYVIYGQKTLMNKPSAFDRINVRRLFLTLEKTTKNLLKYFVFEPNTFATRSRLINALSPTFNQAKANDGLYDYRIICDEKNNTPDVIDNNELKISIYIQPVRTAEFILADFVATRTGVNFNELTS